MGRSCIHFICRNCGEQFVCIDNRLRPEDTLLCSRGHLYDLTQEERDKINLAFREYVSGSIEVYL